MSDQSNQRLTRKQTPRVPSNFLYGKLVPIALAVLVVVLVVIIAAVLLSLFAPAGTY
jgi:hypothetical protein